MFWGVDLGKTAHQHEPAALVVQLAGRPPALGEGEQGVGKGLFGGDFVGAADQIQVLGEEVGQQVMFGPASYPAFEAAFPERGGGARRGRRPHRPLIVVEGLEPQVPVVGVHQLVQHQVYRMFGCHIERRFHQIAERMPAQQWMVHAEPPDAPRVDALIEQMAHGLVEHGGLADSARAEDQMEPPRCAVQEPPQHLCQRPLSLVGQSLWHASELFPGVLPAEDPIDVLGLGFPCSSYL